MKFENVCIESVGYILPPNVVTSAMIEERLAPLYDRLKLPHGRLELMSGIRERRFWNPGTRPSAVAQEAGKQAVAASGIPLEKFGALFHCAVCRDYLEPATASFEHNSLGLRPDCMVFDISNACLGVLNGIITLAAMIELGHIEAGIVMAGEMGETLVESTINSLLSDPNVTRQSVKLAFASLTIGSGAVAVTLASRKISKTGLKLIGGVARADTSSNNLCTSDMDLGFSSNATPLMQTDSEELLKAGCKLAADTWKDFISHTGWNPETISRCFTHQVGVAHRRLLYQSIGVDMAKDFATLEFLGNVGSVSLPITFGMGLEQEAFKKGDRAVLMGIGSGLNSVMLGLEW
ncbi:MAG: 3-oxoacyl-ACP synthase III [Nitrospinae bacterium]|nr:3-oxoacyl-ACP synthase III [Nitrospinota bacterium]